MLHIYVDYIYIYIIWITYIYIYLFTFEVLIGYLLTSPRALHTASQLCFAEGLRRRVAG